MSPEILPEATVAEVAPPAHEKLPYRLRDGLLTRGERAFYWALVSACEGWATIWGKVSLGDLFFVNDREQSMTMMNRIDRKHIDFLLCDHHTLEPLAAIELDDRTHLRSSRQARDAFVDEVFQAANLPLVRVPAQLSYDSDQLKALILAKVALASAIGADAQDMASWQRPDGSTFRGYRFEAPKGHKVAERPAPTCPICGETMLMRKARRGPRAGKPFWGCPNYPRCHAIINIDEPEPRSAGQAPAAS